MLKAIVFTAPATTNDFLFWLKTSLQMSRRENFPCRFAFWRNDKAEEEFQSIGTNVCWIQ